MDNMSSMINSVRLNAPVYVNNAVYGIHEIVSFARNRIGSRNVFGGKSVGLTVFVDLV